MMKVAQDADIGPTKLSTMIVDKGKSPTKAEVTTSSENTKTRPSKNTGDDDVEGLTVDEANETQRYLPKNKKPDAALTFPEKVCLDNRRILLTGVMNVETHHPFSSSHCLSSLLTNIFSTFFWYRAVDELDEIRCQGRRSRKLLRGLVTRWKELYYP
jgi:hypothetical protein